MQRYFIYCLLLFSVYACNKSEIISDSETIKDNIESNFLVINAGLTETSRTDIEKGKSSWIEGDEITVIYDGQKYDYTATASGTETAFTSKAGIVGYDESKTIVAYYPSTGIEGKVLLSENRTVFSNSDTQSNLACAPLVGVKSNAHMENDNLVMRFKNIFSVLELRLDAGDIESQITSLTIEPANLEDFEGFLSFEGTVNPNTLELTPETTSDFIRLEFQNPLIASKPQIIKIPIGRFSTNSGLKLTFYSDSGKSYPRVIYKTGVSSYEQEDEKITLKHLIKPLYALSDAAGGIYDVEDLLAFASAVNNGESIIPWTNDEGKVVLLNDIDMADVETWEPIGKVQFNWSSNKITIESGKPFEGYFDGQNHTIRNFNMNCIPMSEKETYGLFGCVASGAVVENIIFDESCRLTIEGDKAIDSGVLAGLVYDATIRNITNNAVMDYSAESPDNVRATMGIIGFAFAEQSNTLIQNVINNADINAKAIKNLKNGGTSIQAGGICGFSTNADTSDKLVKIVGCLNYGDMETSLARISGIVASANRYTEISDCKNYGNSINTHSKSGNARLGNITCITGTGSSIYRTINYGDIISSTSAAAGGIICLVNDNGNIFDGCENYGRVISDKAVLNDDKLVYTGTFFGQCNKSATFSKCTAGGGIGLYSNGEYKMYDIDETNYMIFIGQTGTAATSVTPENISFSAIIGTTK